MSIESELQTYIASEVLAEEKDSELQLSDSLMSSGRVDSLGLLKIVSFIQEKYDVDVMATGDPEDFETIASLASAVQRGQ